MVDANRSDQGIDYGEEARMSDNAPSWTVQPFDSPIDVDLPTEGAQWQHHLRTALNEVVQFGAFEGSHRELGLPDHGSLEIAEYRVQDSTLTSRLWVSIADRWVLIVSDGPQDDAQVAPWIRAVEAANARMTDQHPTFRWVALVGPAPSEQESGMGLTGPATVGPLELRPGGVCHTEHVRSSIGPPSFSSRVVFQSWPVIVEGMASGYNWYPAQEAATRDLNRLCALLTVAFGRTWTVRQGPAMVEEGEAQIVIPEYGRFEEHHGDSDLAHDDVSVPSWLSSAWDVAVGEQLASDALGAYYEGMLLRDAHPSIALLAFVAAIEAVGQKRLPAERCECCNAVTNSGERFRQALILVVSEDEATTLKRMAYGPWSRTVHAAKLHGREAVRGAVSTGSLFGIEPSYRFEMATVRQLEWASRQLVQRLLKGEISEVT
jgi:hypothetical protein